MNFSSICFSIYFLFRDRIRTSVNILGDGIGAGVVDHLVRQELGPIDLEEGENTTAPINPRKSSTFASARRSHVRDELNETSKL